MAIMAKDWSKLTLGTARVARDLYTLGLELGHLVNEKDGYMNKPGEMEADDTMKELGIDRANYFKYLGFTIYPSEEKQVRYIIMEM